MNDAGAFTARGRIWAGSLEAATQSWLAGLGPSWFATVGLSTQALGSEANSGHNLFVHVAVTSGLIGLLVYGALFARLAMSMRGSNPNAPER